ncbi:MAG: hypothetical protein ACRC2T_17360 [Thermoguttaceae bacterium]
MSINNPLTDPRIREEELLAITQQQFLKALTEEEEKLRKKNEQKNVEARGDDNEPEASAKM